MPDLKDIVLPEFFRPNTIQESYEIVRRLTGHSWKHFSPPRDVNGADHGKQGGQHFLALRAKGPKSVLVQGLCWLCGQDVLDHRELIIALGRKPKLRDGSDGGWEETISGKKVQAEPTPELLEKIYPYGLDTWPIKDFEKKTGKRDYDQDLPDYSEVPYIYVIEDNLGDVKVGISREPRWRLRQLESSEKTPNNEKISFRRWYCTKATHYAFTIEQAVLNHFGKGRRPNDKKSEEWLWQVTFEEAKAAVERELVAYR